METDAGRSRVLCAVAGTVMRPNATFRTISDFPARYFASSVAIFAAVCIASLQSPSIQWLEYGGDALGSSVLVYVRTLIQSVFQNFIFLLMVFWIGGRYAENRRFKDMFPVLSYCMIPLIVLATATPAWHLIGSPGFAHGGGYIGGGVLAGYTTLLIQNTLSAFFMAWAFVLFVKATKISRGLGTGKSAVVVALATAATYFITIAFTILGGIFVPFAWI